jgi:hypothetical protein
VRISWIILSESSEHAASCVYCWLSRPHGYGVGRRMVKECTLFARLVEATRHLYQEEGYKLLKQEPQQVLVGQTRELTL